MSDETQAVGQSMDSIRDVQAAQARHAKTLEIQRLARLHPVVREMVEELEALKASADKRKK